VVGVARGGVVVGDWEGLARITEFLSVG
jgi:hypothetical protein